ncbi:Uncharacterised protein [Mycobacteroides abscessus subsp. abscessus]|nr:Uncharacterised protein [Mycobacteroides abscessus subsp. abscessus]
MTDCQGQRVGGIRGFGRGLQIQDAGDHRGHLGFVGPAVAGDRRLDLRRGVEIHLDPPFCGAERDHPAGLRRAHHGGDVLLGEDALDGNDVGAMSLHPMFNDLTDH